MAHRSPIEWTQSTWNPITGCTKLSTGCKHCYAKRMAERLQAMGQPNYVNRLRADASAAHARISLNAKRKSMSSVPRPSSAFPLGGCGLAYPLALARAKHRDDV